MNAPKLYSPPQVVRVALDHEQAVLSVCSTMASTLMAGGGGTGCRNGNCKNGNRTSADDAARAS